MKITIEHSGKLLSSGLCGNPGSHVKGLMLVIYILELSLNLCKRKGLKTMVKDLVGAKRGWGWGKSLLH